MTHANMYPVLPLYVPGIAESYPVEYEDNDAEKEAARDQCDEDARLEWCHNIIACFVILVIVVAFTRHVTFPVVVWAVAVYVQLLTACIRSLTVVVALIKTWLLS